MTAIRRFVRFATLSAVLLGGCDAAVTAPEHVPGPARQSGTAVPTPPVNGRATYLHAPYHVELTWTHDGTNAPTHYVVERKDATETAFRRLGFGPITQTRFTDVFFDEWSVGRTDHYFVYRIYACNSAGCSGPNEVAVAVPRLEPAGSVTATPGPYSIMLRWQDNSTNNTDYRITWSSSQGGEGSFVVGDVSEYAFGPVSPGVTYTFTIQSRIERTWTEYVTSAPSNAASASAYADLPPGPVEGTATYNASIRRVVLSWAHPYPAAVTHWTIERKEYGTAQQWQVVYTSQSAGTPVAGRYGYVDAVPEDPWQGHSYLYRIRACNPSGCSGPNEISVWTPPSGGPPPAAPASGQGLTTFDASQHAVIVRWEHPDPSSVTHFTIERAVAGAAQGWQQVGTVYPGSGFSYTDAVPRVASGTSYLYRIRACNAGGCSSPNEISIWVPPYSG